MASKGRPAGELAALAGFVIATVVVGGAAMASAIVGVTRSARPDVALKFSSEDSLALVAGADDLYNSPDKAAIDRALDYGRRSVLAGPINPRAFRLLGMANGIRNDMTTAQRQILFSQSQSRRELTTQLWLIEERVQANDVPGALRHYDIALRSSAGAADILYPVLTAAIGDPVVRQSLAPYLRQRAQWVSGFLAYGLKNGDPANVAYTLIAAGKVPDTATLRPVTASLISYFADVGQLALLRRYYLATAGARPEWLTSVGFETMSDNRAVEPIQWEMTRAEGVYGNVQTGENGAGLLTLAADSAARGWAARKVVYLKPGRYRLTIDYAWQSRGEDASAALTLACGNRKMEPAAVRITLSNGANLARGEVSLPAACVGQIIALDLAGGGSGAELNIRKISIQPLQS